MTPIFLCYVDEVERSFEQTTYVFLIEDFMYLFVIP